MEKYVVFVKYSILVGVNTHSTRAVVTVTKLS